MRSSRKRATSLEAVHTAYERRFNETLAPLADSLEKYLRDLLRKTPRIDSIRVRAKSIERFMGKAGKMEGGKRKYADPLNQIQDQIGARIIVFYASDVEPIASNVVKGYFRHIEERVVVPDSPSEFGYEGRHFVLFVPSEVIRSEWSRSDYPTFFELQVKTLFQHAWGEANHDLGYKAPTELTLDQRRKMAFTAAQAWGADRVFDELAQELGVCARPAEVQPGNAEPAAP